MKLFNKILDWYGIEPPKKPTPYIIGFSIILSLIYCVNYFFTGDEADIGMGLIVNANLLLIWFAFIILLAYTILANMMRKEGVKQSHEQIKHTNDYISAIESIIKDDQLFRANSKS